LHFSQQSAQSLSKKAAARPLSTASVLRRGASRLPS
jgi:hypothetical protein